MDDLSSNILNSMFESLPAEDPARSPSRDRSSEHDDGKSHAKGGWRGLSALKAQASMQDKLLEKYVARVAATASLFSRRQNLVS